MGKRDTIRVFLRIRPDKDGLRLAPGYSVEHTFDDSKIHFHLDRRARDDFGVNSSVEDYTFRFDRIFEPQVTQEEIFNMVARDCVASALDGYNSTIFAYGQTGSGKTFSITGGTSSYNDRGIIPRSISMIYDEIAKRTDFQWTVKVSYLQIYNDKGQDLLNHGEDARSLEDLPLVTVHETDEEIVMRGLEAHPSPTARDALQLLFLGDTNRLYCETPMNASSSRSHCVFTILLEARQHGSATVRTSKLNLVDLAGSERVSKTGVEGTLLQEAKYINISLHYLEHVIVALAEQSQGRRDHVPFRNSMMTMALRDSLGGNCRTVMLATGHPGERFLMETVSTCKFAQRVACIKQNAHVNEVTDPAVLVRKLQREIVQLKDKIAFLDKGEQKADRVLNADEMERCREVVTRYIEDPDPAAQLAGVGGDLARLMACISIMKAMIVHKGGVPKGVALPGVPAPSAPATTSGGSAPSASSSAEAARLQEEINKLTISLQEKENELTLMFSIVEKHNAAKFNATTQTTSEDIARGGISVLAGGVRDRPPPLGQQSHPQLQPSAGAASAASADRHAALLQSAQLEAQRDHLQSEYDISALTDASLLKDRHLAFEAFRKSYRKHEQIEKNKVELKGMYERCEVGGKELSALQETLKRLKTRIQQLRTERALQCIDAPDAEETALLQQLQAAREASAAKVAALEKERERVEHMHLVMKRTQEQLIKDFEEWFTLRQKQVALAQRAGGAGAGGHPQPSAHVPTPPAGPDFYARAPTLPSSAPGSLALQQQQQQASALVYATAPSSAESHTRPPPAAPVPSSGGTGLLSGSIMNRLAQARTSPPLQPPAGAAGAALSRVTSGVAFAEEQHLQMRAEEESHRARLAAADPAALANPYAPQYRSTGNAAADAELAKMYRARDELRSQLAGTGGGGAAAAGTSGAPRM